MVVFQTSQTLQQPKQKAQKNQTDKFYILSVWLKHYKQTFAS